MAWVSLQVSMRMANFPAVMKNLVAEWIHFTHVGILLPAIKPKVYTFWGLMNSATK